MRRSLMQTAASLALLVLASHFAAAQAPKLKTRTREDRERAFQSSHRITVNVQVTDGAGKPVTDLDAKDFTILDNHQPRKLATFHAVDGEALNDATEAIILLDAVNTPAPALQAEQKAIFKYLAQSHSALPYLTSFVLWSNGHLKAVAATRDRNAVGKAFVSMTKNLRSNACAPEDVATAKASGSAKADSRATNAPAPAPVTAAANCLQVHLKDSLGALDGIAQQQLHLGGRTILIWVGAGWPGSELTQLPPQARKSFLDERVEILKDLRTSQITLDALGAGEIGSAVGAASPVKPAAENHPAFPPVTSQSNDPASSIELPILAQQTGGRVIATSQDIATDLGKLVEDANWYYALSFNPPPAANGVELRSVEVKVNRPGVQVRTLTGYYTDPY